MRPHDTRRGACLKTLRLATDGECRGAKPLCRGTGVPPVFAFITPFLARKGDGGMVERVAGHQTHKSKAGVLRQSPRRARGRLCKVCRRSSKEAPAIKIDYADLVSFSTRLLSAAGVVDKHAEPIARLLVRADLDGYPGHGIRRLVGYLGRVKRGVTQIVEPPRIVREGKTTAVIDGNLYIGQAVALEAMGLAIAKAGEHGVGIVCVRRSGHVGRLADYVELAADRGMIGIAAVSVGGGSVAPHGAMQPAWGTNPIAVGIPGKDGEHIIFDAATAAMSRSELGQRLARGEEVPPGVLLDGGGNPTTDYGAFIGPPRGVVLPFGGYKGSALGMVAEVLGGILSGNGLGPEWLDRGAAAVNGLWFQAIDVREFQELDAFEAKVEELRSFVHSRRPAPGFDEVRLPGDRARKLAAERRSGGVPVADGDWEAMLRSAQELSVADVPAPLETRGAQA